MALQTLVTGKIIGLYSLPAFTDKKTGEVKSARYRVQLLSESITKNSENRCDFHEVAIPNKHWFQPHFGAIVSFPATQWNMEGRTGLKLDDAFQPEDITVKKPVTPATVKAA